MKGVFVMKKTDINKLVVCMPRITAGCQVSQTRVKSNYRNNSVAQRYALLCYCRLLNWGINIAYDKFKAHSYAFSLMSQLECGELYVASKVNGEYIGHIVTRSVSIVTNDKEKQRKLLDERSKVLNRDIDKQLLTGRIKAWEVITAPDGTRTKRSFTVRTKNSLICPLGELKMFRFELSELLRLNKAVMYYKDGNKVNIYRISMNNKRYENFDMNSPDDGVLNMPVIDTSGRRYIKAVNVFCIEDIFKIDG